jgi:hypothetical protein
VIDPSQATVAGRTYGELRSKARRDGRPFDELLSLYTLEGFLERLARSAHVSNPVLKGGLLLAAYDARRPTERRGLRRTTLREERPPATTTSTSASAYTSTAGVDLQARTRLTVDVNVGDPISPAPQQVNVPRF